jgi:CarD family transcriptional regulator
MAKTATSSKRAVKKLAGKRAEQRKAARARPDTKGTKPKAKAPPSKLQAKRSAAPAPARTAGKASVAKSSAKAQGSKGTARAPIGEPKKVLLPKEVAIRQAMAAAARPAAGGVRSMPAAVNKAAGQRIMAPVNPVPSVGKPAAEAAKRKPVNQRHGFKTNEWIVYPAHGVGRIVAIEEQEIAGISLELFVITFEKDKMTLRVPTGKSQSVGMRKLAEEGTVKKAMDTLKGRARIKRTMWSRRAQEYEAKINSGDLVSIAEVVRDLYRSESQPEQSYSERQLYEAALDRMAREIAAVEKLDERGAVQRLTEILAKSARGRRLAAEDAEVKAA